MKYLLGAVIAIVTIFIVFLIFLYSGVYNISAAEPHTSATLWMINTLKDNSIRNHAGEIRVPDLSDTSMVNRGFMRYKEMCGGCHGAPGVDRKAKGFYPEPPLLTEAAADWNTKELFWIIKNGIKMTAMPSFGARQSDDVIWTIAVFTKKLPNISKEEYQRMLDLSKETVVQ